MRQAIGTARSVVGTFVVMDTITCLWAGPIHNERDAVENSAVSIAANRWQISFITRLSEKLSLVDNFSYLPQRAFPIGKLIPFDDCQLAASYSHQIRYLNVRGLREFSMAWGMIKKFTQLAAYPEILFTYNASFAHRSLGYIANRRGAIWVNIVADGGYCKRATLNVFLAHSHFLEAHIEESRKVYFPGGLGERFPTTPTDNLPRELGAPRVLLYAGSYSKWTGVENLLDDYLSVDRSVIPNVELHLYGFSPREHHKRLMLKRKDIVFHGLVDPFELSRAISAASVLVNPRPENLRGGDRNFPSKLLLYLESGQPILSTVTRSLGPAFLKHLVVYESGKSFGAGLMAALSRAEEGGNGVGRKSSIKDDAFSWDQGVQKILTAVGL